MGVDGIVYTGMRDLSGRKKLLSGWTMVTVAPPCNYALNYMLGMGKFYNT